MILGSLKNCTCDQLTFDYQVMVVKFSFCRKEISIQIIQNNSLIEKFLLSTNFHFRML